MHGLATLSFTIYLTHKMVIHAVHGVLAPHGLKGFDVATVLACVVAVPAAAWLMHRLVEAPALALRDRILERRRPAPLPLPEPVP